MGNILRRFYWLALSIILAAAGQSLSIVTDAGSLIWPASIVNILHFTGWPMAIAITFEGTLVIVLTTMVEWHHPFRHILPDLEFLLPYAILMQLFATIWKAIKIPEQIFAVRLLIDIASFFIIFLGAAISGNVRFCCHPNDTLTQTCNRCLGPRRTRYLNLVLPIILIFVLGFLNRHPYAFHVGTIIAYLIRPRVLDFYNTHLRIKLV